MKRTFILYTLVAVVFGFGIQTSFAKDFQMGIAHLGKGGSVLDKGAQKWGALIQQKSGGRISILSLPTR